MSHKDGTTVTLVVFLLFLQRSLQKSLCQTRVMAVIPMLGSASYCGRTESPKRCVKWYDAASSEHDESQQLFF